MLDELKILFVQEVSDLLKKVEEDLLILEKDKNNIDVIQNIFRAVHTIKGSAGVYNLEKTVEIAHNFETLFENVKNGKLKVSNEIISLTLLAKDTLLKLITAETEDVVGDEEMQELIYKISTFKVEDTSTEELPLDTSNYKTYYILFEPNDDIEERGIDIESILNDFNEFKYKIVTKKTDNERDFFGKTEDFYEIIISTAFSVEDISAIFMFVPNEVVINQISGINIFEQTDFVDFFENAVDIVPEIDQRIELLVNFCSVFEEDDSLQETPEINEAQNEVYFDEDGINERLAETEDILIGEDELNKENKENKQQIEQIRVPAKKLDELLNLVSELIINNSQLTKRTIEKDYSKIIELSENISKITNVIKENTLSLRLIPIENIIPPYKRLIRDLSLKFNKKIYFVADGVDTMVDKNIIEKLFTPLSHIIRNAIDHGIESPEERLKKGKGETGIIRFIAFYSSTNVFIQLQDDGRGIDPEKVKNKAVKMGLVKEGVELSKKEIYDLLFIHGFTTTEEVTDISGRGVGMDAIKKSIQDLRGDVEIDSEIELGTSITIKLPLTLSIVETMHLTAGDMNVLIPLSNITQCIKYDFDEISKHDENSVIINDEIIPIINIKKVFNITNNINNIEEKENIIIVKHGQGKVGLVFNTIEGEYQAVVKNLGSVFREYDYFLGASILADGSIGYILDSYKLINKIIK